MSRGLHYGNCFRNFVRQQNYMNTYYYYHRIYCGMHKISVPLHAAMIDDTNATENRASVEQRRTRSLIRDSLSLKDFITPEPPRIDISPEESIPYVQDIRGEGQKVYFEIYGCQMNVNDTEIIWSILKARGYQQTKDMEGADIVLLITCSIRDNAEQKVWNKLEYLNVIRNKRRKKSGVSMKIGLLGCMAERLKTKILDKGKLVDVIAGPDSYKDLPRLLAVTDSETAVNVVLSFDETYADVMPVRLNQDRIGAYVSIMRGCDNMCTYCIVPFTRGRERSRPIMSILDEVRHLSDQGIKEVTLLGQNVNSYRDLSQLQFVVPVGTGTHLAKGFKTVYKGKKGGLRFCDLLDKVSLIDPEMRVRFTSPHPKDFPDEVLHLIAERPNICKQIHLPAQSGNSAVLVRMRRGYTREAYLDLVHNIRDILPDVYLSADFIAGFCGETEEEFQDTLSLLEQVKYNYAYMFAYSMREKTTAHRRYKDDVEQRVKIERVARMITLYRREAEKLNKAQIGQRQLVLVEGVSRRTDRNLQGRNDGNVRILLPPAVIPVNRHSDSTREMRAGDYVVVQIDNANSQSLRAVPLYHSSISEYSSEKQELLYY
ncbi:CDK5RAP1-like protein [Harpegnathos saltator]|uniref:CDK5RAP1-like protein n=1 Tax=Harpegnathos saltator TaxID=610380 RepID=UPI00058B4ADF|nr:CDK5RAP1-like protein [Harpegnathos saltator]XP_011145176.1 CDK5RAP1-like protein [Harpegnathos saltator]XP_025157412.1 CDK5RAP1-like protein [Harpegnathos saltator]